MNQTGLSPSNLLLTPSPEEGAGTMTGITQDLDTRIGHSSFSSFFDSHCQHHSSQQQRNNMNDHYKSLSTSADSTTSASSLSCSRTTAFERTKSDPIRMTRAATNSHTMESEQAAAYRDYLMYVRIMNGKQKKMGGYNASPKSPLDHHHHQQQQHSLVEFMMRNRVEPKSYNEKNDNENVPYASSEPYRKLLLPPMSRRDGNSGSLIDQLVNIDSILSSETKGDYKDDDDDREDEPPTCSTLDYSINNEEDGEVNYGDDDGDQGEIFELDL